MRLSVTDCPADLPTAPAALDVAAAPAAWLDAGSRQALREATARLDEAEASGRPLDLCAALVPVARCYRAMGAAGPAEDALRLALRNARLCGSGELLVEILCELAETACAIAQACDPSQPSQARAARERARDEAFEATTLTHRTGDPAWQAQAFLRISDILNRCGDHDDAAGLQGLALQRMRPA